MATNQPRKSHKLTPEQVADAQRQMQGQTIPGTGLPPFPITEPMDWQKQCGRCGHTITRYRGMTYVYCSQCGAEHNAGGQRLRDDWRGNPSSWDEDVSDLEGYEIQHANDDAEPYRSEYRNGGQM